MNKRLANFLIYAAGAAILVAAGPTSSQVLEDLKLVEGDERGNELRSVKAELLVLKSEKQAIEQAKKLLKKHRGTALEPDLHFRLAELYMRKSKSDRFFEVHRESETVVKLVPKTVRSASSRSSIKQAVYTYGTIQRRFPGFKQMDIVVYNHAFARQLLGEEKLAEGLYQQLISRFGGSGLLPDAHLAIGEMEFQRGKFTRALEHFNAITKFPKSRVYPYGLYKAAWTHYNMRDAQKALKKLEEVVAFGRQIAKNKGNARLDLRKEALNDMTLFFEDVYPSKNALKYFTAQAGEEEVGPILLRMANLYQRHSRFRDQQIVLDDFIREIPHSPLIPQVHTDLVAAYDNLRQKEKAVERLADLAKYCPTNSSWSKAQANTPEGKSAPKECLNMLNETSLKMAKRWLRVWKKAQADKTYADAAEKAFEIYLATPSTSEEHIQSRFSYADLLFARKKYREASGQYAQVSRSGQAHKLEHDASYAAVLSLEKAVGENWSNDDERTFHQLAQEYVKKNPKGQYRLDIEYKMALLAYEKGHYNDAGPIFLRLGREFANNSKGQRAQDLYLDILNIKKDYRAIRNYSAELMKGTGDAGRSQKMRKLYEQAYFLEVQGIEEKGKDKEALAQYIAFTKENPNSEFTEKALWNTLQLYFKTGDALNGSKTSEEFANRYPKSPQTNAALLKAAQTYEFMAQLKEAARVLEKIAQRDPKEALKWKEMAADYYAMDGMPTQARRLYTELRSGANSEKRTRLVSKLDTLEKTHGSKQQQAEVARMIADMNIQPQANIARVQVVEEQFNRGQHSEAFNAARRLLSAGMNNNQKARLRLVQAKVLEREFLQQSVKARTERIAQVLAIKTEKLQKAQEALQGTIRYGDPQVSLEAFERLYGCYAHYVKALKEMPAPAGLSKDDEQMFRDELQNLVIPLEEKSVDTLAQAVDFAKKQPSLSGAAGRLERELFRLNHQFVSGTADFRQPEMALPVLSGVGP